MRSIDDSRGLYPPNVLGASSPFLPPLLPPPLPSLILPSLPFPLEVGPRYCG